MTPVELVAKRRAAAIWLAEQGFAIVHIKQGHKDPDGGLEWQHRAITDPGMAGALIKSENDQFGAFPKRGSRLMVIDQDVVDKLEALGVVIPVTLRVQTSVKDAASGWRGQHVYLRLADGIDESEVPRTWEGGEVRLAGSGQVVGPWSRHPSGLLYEPVDGVRVIGEAGRELIDALRASKQRKSHGEGSATGPDDPGWFITTGKHEHLVEKGRRMRRDGLTGERLRDELLRLDHDRHRPPIADITGRGVAEIESIVEWIMKEIDDEPPPLRIVTEPAAPATGSAEPVVTDPWPAPPDDAAYHGVAGDLVRAVEAHTEADPIAILGSILAIFGAVVGDHQTLFQGSQQRANLFVALVGETSTSRKGTATSIARDIYAESYPAWEQIIVPGLGSGEGLVGYLKRHAEEDHRALVLETELGRLLGVMGRDGSTLSPILRDAWDGQALGRVLARDEAIIHRHHVGILAHITPTELRSGLTDVDGRNGFANRFLWFAVRRTRLVPFPTSPKALIAPYREALHQAIVEAQAPAELVWSPTASERWEALYAESAMRRSYGLASAVTARAEAQTARLALVYALLDRSNVVDLVHLEAAEALWDYARRSAVFIFGNSTGDRHADALRRLLADGPVDWSDAKRELGLRTAADLDAAMAVLADLGIAQVATVARDGGGRPKRVVTLIDGANHAKGANNA